MTYPAFSKDSMLKKCLALTLGYFTQFMQFYSVDEDCVQFCSDEEYCDADTNSCDEVEKAEVYRGKTLSNPSVATESSFKDSISLNSCNHSATLAGPQLSESPKFSKT